MKFPTFLAKRYLLSKSSNNAINIITGIAALGIVIGAMSLFIVLSGFAGLKDFSLQFTNYFDSDYKVLPEKGKTFQVTSEEFTALEKSENIIAYSRIIEERVFLHFKSKSHIAYIKGIDENYGKVNAIDSILYAGKWLEEGASEVVIGTGTASRLSLGMYDYTDLLEIYVPKPGKGQILEPSNAFNRQNAVVSGVYYVADDINSKYVFSDFDFAKNLLQLNDNEVYALEVKAKPGISESVVRAELLQILGEDLIIKNRMQQNDALYKMLNTENIAVYLIFTLVLIVALFNVIGSIIMMILDKRKDIHTLFNLGATIKSIRRAFFLQGALMTSIGGLVGVLLGILVVGAQLQWKLVYITPSLPYPVKLKFENIILVLGTIFLLGLIASKIAATRVKKSLIE